MKWIYTYRDANNEIIFKTVAENGIEADKLFEQTIGKEALKMPMVTCMSEAFRENANVSPT